MVTEIFNILQQVQELQRKHGSDKNYYQPCIAGNKIGLLHVEIIHPNLRHNKSIFITLQVGKASYTFEGIIEKNILFFSKVTIPHSIFKENFVASILIEIIKIVKSYKTETIIFKIKSDEYFKRINVPFRLCGFTASRGTTGDFHIFTGVFSKLLK